MTPAVLAAAGRVLTGSAKWRRPLARQLGCDPALVRRWARGAAPVPEWAVRRLAELVRERLRELAALL